MIQKDLKLNEKLNPNTGHYGDLKTFSQRDNFSEQTFFPEFFFHAQFKS